MSGTQKPTIAGDLAYVQKCLAVDTATFAQAAAHDPATTIRDIGGDVVGYQVRADLLRTAVDHGLPLALEAALAILTRDPRWPRPCERAVATVEHHAASLFYTTYRYHQE
jgi:hypothetical protein